jgi:hypothetical protein
MKTLFRKTILLALVLALGLASLPLVSASAAGAYGPPVPGEGQGQTPNERLEKAWARQLGIYERMGKGFERDDAFIDRVQKLIDRAKANGKDVSAVQAALDAFKAAIQKAEPIYESAKGIVNSHQGFDANGKVTDAAKAQETVNAMRTKFKEIKDAMGGTGRALHEAIKAFREANPPPKRPTPTPASE